MFINILFTDVFTSLAVFLPSTLTFQTYMIPALSSFANYDRIFLSVLAKKSQVFRYLEFLPPRHLFLFLFFEQCLPHQTSFIKINSLCVSLFLMFVSLFVCFKYQMLLIREDLLRRTDTKQSVVPSFPIFLFLDNIILV